MLIIRMESERDSRPQTTSRSWSSLSSTGDMEDLRRFLPQRLLNLDARLQPLHASLSTRRAAGKKE